MPKSKKPKENVATYLEVGVNLRRRSLWQRVGDVFHPRPTLLVEDINEAIRVVKDDEELVHFHWRGNELIASSIIWPRKK